MDHRSLSSHQVPQVQKLEDETHLQVPAETDVKSVRGDSAGSLGSSKGDPGNSSIRETREVSQPTQFPVESWESGGKDKSSQQSDKAQKPTDTDP